MDTLLSKFHSKQKFLFLFILVYLVCFFPKEAITRCGPEGSDCFFYTPGTCCCDDQNPSKKLICRLPDFTIYIYLWLEARSDLNECLNLTCPISECGICSPTKGNSCCVDRSHPNFGKRCTSDGWLDDPLCTDPCDSCNSYFFGNCCYRRDHKNYGYRCTNNGWVPDILCGMDPCNVCNPNLYDYCCLISGHPNYGKRCTHDGWLTDGTCVDIFFPPYEPPLIPNPLQPPPNTTNPNDNQQVDAGDPVSTATGEFHHALDLLRLKGPMNLEYLINYGSQKLPDNNPDGLPQGFDSSSTNALSEEKAPGTNATLINFEAPNGEEMVFEEQKTSPNIKGDIEIQNQQITIREWRSPKNTRFIYQLKETRDYFYILNPEFDRVLMFKKILVNNKIKARIQRIEDRNGNSINYEYADDRTFLPRRITDGLGREIRFNYTQFGDKQFISSVEDQGNRLFQLTYGTSSGKNVLTSLRDAENASTGFLYQSDELISQIRKPKGNIPYTQTYNSKGVVLEQKTHLNNVTSFKVFKKDATTTQTITSYPDGTTRVFEHSKDARVVSNITDEAGNTIIYESDPQREQIISVTDRLGNKTFYSYHRETGKIKSITNANGSKTEYEYVPQEQTFTNPFNNERVTFTFYNNSKISVPEGTYEFQYDLRGNVVQVRDLKGKITRYTYNNRGQLLTATNALGEVIETNTYNADGTLATKTYPDIGTINYGYDNLKRLTRITYPDGTSETFGYDRMDRLTFKTDANGNRFSYRYDTNGNLISVISPTGLEKRYEYDEMDRVVEIIDKTGRKTSLTYDSRERINSITTPDNIKTQYSYDPRGWANNILVGQSNTKIDYNNEAFPISLNSPEGRKYTTEYDKIGYVSSISDPMGNKTSFSYDLMGRLTRIVEPLNRNTSFGYTSGFLTSVEKTNLGKVQYTRNDLDLVTKIKDLKGSEWLFDYTRLGRLIALTDPVGNKWFYEYDRRGRISKITYPDSIIQTITYDGNGNILRQQFSDGLDIQNQYDRENRLVSSNNIQFSYDNENRVTDTKIFNISFGAQYDAGGKLISVSYNNGQFRVNYVYEQGTGRLKEINDTLTNTRILMGYNAENELISINRPNNINTFYSYDKVGRVNSIQHGTIANFTYTRNTAGEVTQVNYTAPVEPMISPPTISFDYDGASRIKGNGWNTDAQGRVIKTPFDTFKWDGASRLIGINDITLGYTGLGDLINKGTNQFFYNYAIGNKPMVAERSGANFTRFYVWTPEGRLLYMIDAGDGNKVYYYHFDQIGNTVAITDGTGSVKEAYAYAPYGKIIGKKSNFNQPFTFLGEFGVRMEGVSGDIYQMRMRYYESNTGRFLIKEPVWPDLSEPRLLNPYQYAFNSPVNFIDITGREVKTLTEQLKSKNGNSFTSTDVTIPGAGSFDNNNFSGMPNITMDDKKTELLKSVEEKEISIQELDKLSEVNQFFQPKLEEYLIGFVPKVDESGNIEVAKPPVGISETIRKDVGRPGRLVIK